MQAMNGGKYNTVVVKKSLKFCTSCWMILFFSDWDLIFFISSKIPLNKLLKSCLASIGSLCNGEGKQQITGTNGCNTIAVIYFQCECAFSNMTRAGWPQSKIFFKRSPNYSVMNASPKSLCYSRPVWEKWHPLQQCHPAYKLEYKIPHKFEQALI